MVSRLAALDRITIHSALIVGTFLSVLLLSSQSGASFVTYVLSAAMLISIREWNDVRHSPMIWPIVLLLIYLPLTSFWSQGFSWSEFASQAGRALLTLSFVIAFAECQLLSLIHI